MADVDGRDFVAGGRARHAHTRLATCDHGAAVVIRVDETIVDVDGNSVALIEDRSDDHAAVAGNPRAREWSGYRTAYLLINVHGRRTHAAGNRRVSDFYGIEGARISGGKQGTGTSSQVTDVVPARGRECERGFHLIVIDRRG